MSTPASRVTRRLTAAALGVGLVGCLGLGGSMARAAVDPAPSTPSLTVSWTGPDGSTGTPAPPGSPGASDAPAATAPSEDSSALVQTIGVAVLPGPLTVSPTAPSVDLSSVAVFGHRSSFSGGAVPPLTVVDARGSLVGWRAAVTLQAISGADAALLAHVEVCARPAAPTRVDGNPADVVRAAPPSCAAAGQPLPVFWAAPGGGGGTYRDTATLALLVPGPGLPAHLTASLAVSVH